MPSISGAKVALGVGWIETLAVIGTKRTEHRGGFSSPR